MMKENLLFYNAYESFYLMADSSECFKKYCKEAFGEDFSQDGFSDIYQINFIINYVPKIVDLKILDIGCGNGKMAKYLQGKVGGHISGFDFSENAIKTARSQPCANSDFKVGVIGEIDYSAKSFDFVVSMDSIYFAKDMMLFVGQVRRWLKGNGIFCIGYQEGDIMPKTLNSETTVLAQDLNENGFKYDVIDFTKQTYDMLKIKRQAVMSCKNDFMTENLQSWYEVVLNQTNSVTVPFDEYAKRNARYIFIARP